MPVKKGSRPLEDMSYYLRRVTREGWLGTKSTFTCRRLILEHKNILDPQFVGEGVTTRILLRGASIIDFQNSKVFKKI